MTKKSNNVTITSDVNTNNNTITVDSSAIAQAMALLGITPAEFNVLQNAKEQYKAKNGHPAPESQPVEKPFARKMRLAKEAKAAQRAQAQVVIAKVKATAKTSDKPANNAEFEMKGVHVHQLENSFFVYGNDATAKLAGFFQRKPHLNRGYILRDIKGLGKVKAYWFGGRQFAKVMKAIGK